MKLKQINKRRLFSIKEFLLNSFSRKASLRCLVATLYQASQENQTLIKDYLDLSNQACTVITHPTTDGNVSYFELLTISALIKELKPKKLLEIGTFNGLTTLHMALNSDTDALIHTLDLDPSDKTLLEKASIEDIKFIKNKEKEKKIFYSFNEKEKILEHKGNSLHYDFSSFGEVDFIFIDGGHSFDIVKNDTEKALSILSNNGCILWHDYNPNCPGVFDYLNHLFSTHKLLRIKNTSLVVFKSTLK